MDNRPSYVANGYYGIPMTFSWFGAYKPCGGYSPLENPQERGFCVNNTFIWNDSGHLARGISQEAAPEIDEQKICVL
jgi:hypothetical protein